MAPKVYDGMACLWVEDTPKVCQATDLLSSVHLKRMGAVLWVQVERGEHFQIEPVPENPQAEAVPIHANGVTTRKAVLELKNVVRCYLYAEQIAEQRNETVPVVCL